MARKQESSNTRILKRFAKRSHDAVHADLSRAERARLVASAAATVEAAQDAQGPRHLLFRHALKKGTLEVTNAFNDAFTKDGKFVEDADAVERAYKEGVSNKPKEVNQRRIGKVARAAGAWFMKDSTALEIMRGLEFADVLDITEKILERRFKGLPSLEGMTMQQAYAILDDPRIVDRDDVFRKDGTLHRLADGGDTQLVPSKRTKRTLRAARAGLLQGHANWEAGQPFRARKEGKDDRIEVYGVVTGEEGKDYGISRINPDGSVHILSDEEIRTNRSVSYNPFDVTVEATFVKFVRKLTDAGYKGDIVKAARLRTAYEILKDREQFGKPGDPIPQGRRSLKKS